MSAPLAAFAGSPAAPTAAQVQPAERVPAKQVQGQEQTYAQREEQSKELEKFEGGQTVVIVTSLTTILLVAILLVLLL